MTQGRPEYVESQDFLETLRDQFSQSGFNSHPCAASRWNHHVNGVARVLDLLPFLERFMDRPIDAMRVLDVGCASGSGSLAFAFRGYGHVVGVDLTFGALGLQLAHRRARSQALAVDLAQADACRLPIASNSVDFCFCDWVIEHVPTPLALLREMQRVTSPGGLLFVSTNNRLWPIEAHSGLWFTPWLSHQWAGQITARLGRCQSAADWDVWLLTQRQLVDLARQAGFRALATRHDIFPPKGNPLSRLISWTARKSHLVDALAPNIYLMARKSA